MTGRIWNLSAGPAVLPECVLAEAQESLMSLGDTGVGICEHSHRGKAFVGVADEAESLCRELAGIPDNYRVLFLQGGASTQFAMIPMNFLTTSATADYIVTGSWAQKAVKEARLFGNVHVASTSEGTNFNIIPGRHSFSDQPRYVHYTSNNTIFGTQFATEPEGFDGDAFLVCDASSDMFSRPIDVSKYGLIYAGAQKNLGPSGVVLVMIRDDLVEAGNPQLASMLQYRNHASAGSMYNTPPTFGIYLMMLVFRWIRDNGGLPAMGTRNTEKAARLYDAIDRSSLFHATADKASRSQMNVTFVTGNVDRDAQFIQEATAAGFNAIKGHRSVGGMRASIYNAFPSAGVDALIQFMEEFENAE
jgi:phosphoserine aminotransferase